MVNQKLIKAAEALIAEGTSVLADLQGCGTEGTATMRLEQSIRQTRKAVTAYRNAQLIGGDTSQGPLWDARTMLSYWLGKARLQLRAHRERTG